MFRKSAAAVLLCMAVLMAAFAPAVYANTTIIEIDTGGLWGDDILGDGETGNEDSSDDGSSDNGTDNDTTGNNDNYTSNDDDDIDKNIYVPGSSGTTTKPPATSGNDTSVTTPAKPEEPATPAVTANFSDVKEQDWFYSDVGTLAGMGIVNGYPDGSFKPGNNVTRAEFLKLLITLVIGEDNMFVSYDKFFDDVDPDKWYAKYVATAFVYGIIDINDYGTNFNPDQPITRREVAKLVANSVTIEIGGYRTPFADTADHSIIALYRYAIMQGSVDPTTGYRYFYPETAITRAETSAVILRLYKLVQGGESYVQQFMKENNLPPLQALYVPATQNDFYNVLTNAWDKNQAFVVYNYEFGSGSEQMRVLNENLHGAYNAAMVSHPELATYVTLKQTTESDGSTSEVTLEFGSEIDEYTYEGLAAEKNEAEAKAAEIVSQMFTGNENGIKKADMIHDYIMNILEYDFSYSSDAYTAYGALSERKAVCQGYSALFNMMCRAAGVKSLAVATDEHMWNIVLAGGKIYHYDVTVSDLNGNSNNSFKGIEEARFVKDEVHSGYVLPGMDCFS